MKRRSQIIKILKVEQSGRHKLRISFSDGKSQVVNFGPFLKSNQHPEIRKYWGPKKFKSFRVEAGELLWGDFDLIFPIMDLYKNKLDRGL